MSSQRLITTTHIMPSHTSWPRTQSPKGNRPHEFDNSCTLHWLPKINFHLPAREIEPIYIQSTSLPFMHFETYVHCNQLLYLTLAAIKQNKTG